jgi:hypothetical protein
MIRIRRKQETGFVVNTVDIVCIFDDDVDAEAKKDNIGVKYNTQEKSKKKRYIPFAFYHHPLDSSQIGPSVQRVIIEKSHRKPPLLLSDGDDDKTRKRNKRRNCCLDARRWIRARRDPLS